MSRYVGEVRATLYGDPAIAQQYIPYGRKLLYALMQTSPQLTCVREVTDPNGVNVRVGYFNGVPFITITAPESKDQPYSLLVNRGYVSAPVTSVSFTTYSENPAVIMNPFGAMENLWPSTFFNAPEELNGSTHPTSFYTDGFATYQRYFPALSTWAEANSEIFASPRLMSWNNNDESLWLYWFGCQHGRSTYSAFGYIFHNGKMVADLNDYLEYPSMIMGVSARRTPLGLTVYASVIERVNTVHNLRVCKITLKPIDSELKRLNGLEKDSGYGYANEYEVSTFEIIFFQQYTASIVYYSSFPHNQSATECRGFLGFLSGNNIVLEEIVVNYANEEEEIFGIVASTQTLTETVTEVITYGPTYVPGVLVKHINGLSDPDALTKPPGVYTYDQDSAPSKLEKYSSKNLSIAIPLTYDYSITTSLNIKKIRCFVDYANNFPVYAYLHVSDSVTTKNATNTYDEYSTEPTGQLRVTVFDSTPVTASQEWDAQTSWTKSWLNRYERITDSRSYGISAPIYDSEGAELGDWLNETESGYILENNSYSGTDAETASYVFGNEFSGILVGYLRTTGSSLTRSPLIRNTETNSKSISIKYMNLRTKSVFMEKFDSGSVTNNLITFGTLTYITNVTWTGLSNVSWIQDPQQPWAETSHDETYSKVRTIFKHNGLTEFQSAWVDIFAPTSTDTPIASAPGFNPFAFYSSLSWASYENSAAALALANAGNDIWNEDYTMNPHGVKSDVIDPDVDDSFTQTTDLFWPGSDSYALRALQPGNTVGIATTKDSYVVNVNYRSGLSGAYLPVVGVSTDASTIDYMTGAHTAPFYSSPFLLSAIAIDKIKR